VEKVFDWLVCWVSVLCVCLCLGLYRGDEGCFG